MLPPRFHTLKLHNAVCTLGGLCALRVSRCCGTGSSGALPTSYTHMHRCFSRNQGNARALVGQDRLEDDTDPRHFGLDSLGPEIRPYIRKCLDNYRKAYIPHSLRIHSVLHQEIARLRQSRHAVTDYEVFGNHVYFEQAKQKGAYLVRNRLPTHRRLNPKRYKMQPSPEDLEALMRDSIAILDMNNLRDFHGNPIDNIHSIRIGRVGRHTVISLIHDTLPRDYELPHGKKVDCILVDDSVDFAISGLTVADNSGLATSEEAGHSAAWTKIFSQSLEGIGEFHFLPHGTKRDRYLCRVFYTLVDDTERAWQLRMAYICPQTSRFTGDTAVYTEHDPSKYVSLHRSKDGKVLFVASVLHGKTYSLYCVKREATMRLYRVPLPNDRRLLLEHRGKYIYAVYNLVGSSHSKTGAIFERNAKGIGRNTGTNSTGNTTTSNMVSTSNMSTSTKMENARITSSNMDTNSGNGTSGNITGNDSGTTSGTGHGTTSGAASGNDTVTTTASGISPTDRSTHYPPICWLVSKIPTKTLEPCRRPRKSKYHFVCIGANRKTWSTVAQIDNAVVKDLDMMHKGLVVYAIVPTSQPSVYIYPFGPTGRSTVKQANQPERLIKQKLHQVELPLKVGVIEPGSNSNFYANMVTFVLNAPGTTDVHCCLDLDGTLKHEGVCDRQVDHHISYVASRDGTCRIPITLLRSLPDGQAGGGIHNFQNSDNCVVYVYGAYGEHLDLSNDIEHNTLLAMGYTLCFAHVRGGGELGDPWHYAAVKASKHKSFHDLVDVLEFLVAKNITRRNKLCVISTSAGAILPACVYNMRPDLCSCIVLKLPFLDVAGSVGATNQVLTQLEIEEFGDRDTHNMDAVYSYSPCDNLGAATAKPRLVIQCNDMDQRAPWQHVVRFIAQHRDHADNVFLKVSSGGHVDGNTVEERNELTLERISLLDQQLQRPGH
ncbi:oligopeptidase B [Babesia ovis]|uniref:Prolyl endopeptidase-like n=1 Tax=Babesia ovis TaxID=5869 RepID=A0A9W5TAN2_BABOV|nr:oligopeptidase B [Babesia ovis]